MPSEAAALVRAVAALRCGEKGLSARRAGRLLRRWRDLAVASPDTGASAAAAVAEAAWGVPGAFGARGIRLQSPRGARAAALGFAARSLGLAGAAGGIPAQAVGARVLARAAELAEEATLHGADRGRLRA